MPDSSFVDILGLWLIASILFAIIILPIVALLLWALTLITTAITFNWVFVGVIGGVLSVLTGIIAVGSL